MGHRGELVVVREVGAWGGGAWKERHTQKLDRDSCKTRNLGQDKSRQDNVPSITLECPGHTLTGKKK